MLSHKTYELLLRGSLTFEMFNKDSALPTRLKTTVAELLSEHCFDLSGLISVVGVTDICSMQCIREKELFACSLLLYQLPKLAKTSLPNPFAREKNQFCEHTFAHLH